MFHVKHFCDVILSEAKDRVDNRNSILRFAQDDSKPRGASYVS